MATGVEKGGRRIKPSSPPNDYGKEEEEESDIACDIAMEEEEEDNWICLFFARSQQKQHAK